jgi:hypothetical protein
MKLDEWRGLAHDNALLVFWVVGIVRRKVGDSARRACILCVCVDVFLCVYCSSEFTFAGNI